MNHSPSKKKTLKFILFLFFILIALGISAYGYLYSRVPQMSGELKLKGLKAPVQVFRDKYGVPHITALDNLDAFKALGYVMASERLFQMEISRRLAQGELAEILGEKALKSDKLFRNLGLKAEALRIVEKKVDVNSYNVEMHNESEAFYEGVNQFIATGKLPIEFAILGIKPRPFEMIDGVSFVGLMAFSFGTAIMTEPLLTDLVKRIGGDLVEDMRNEKIPKNDTRTVDYNNLIDSKLSVQTLKVIADLEQGFSLFEGSNGWILSAKKSLSGFPILANDPHISYSQPGIWFEAHIKTPTYETYGHFLSLIPFPILSHNREKAWGLTMSLVDDMDLYRENIDTKNETYLYKGENRKLIKRREMIKVKKATDYEMTVYKTHHGPILQDDKTQNLALQWAFYDENNDPFTTLFKMGRAKSVSDFKAAVATGKAPGLNILYADKENIGWWMYGDVWLKRKGIRNDFVLNGESGEDEILGKMKFDEKPHLENPENGMIVSANSRPLNFPADMRGDWQADDRYKTIETVLSKKEKWNPEELMELQSLSMNFENKFILAALLNETKFETAEQKEKYQKYLDILKNWNLSSDTENTAPSIYYTWTNEIQIKLLENLTEDERETWNRVQNAWVFFKRVILERDSPWWKKYDREVVFCETLIRAVSSLEKQLGKNVENWQWGKLHTLELGHPIGRIKPLNLIFNQGPFPIPGATHEVNNQKTTSFKDGFAVKAGPSTRRIIDFGNIEKSWGVLPAGNSGHILSPFYKNQVELFLHGKYREQLLNPTDADILHKLILNP